MQTKIMHLPQRRRNPDRDLAAELRALREQVKALTPHAPWGLGERQ